MGESPTGPPDRTFPLPFIVSILALACPSRLYQPHVLQTPTPTRAEVSFVLSSFPQSTASDR